MNNNFTSSKLPPIVKIFALGITMKAMLRTQKISQFLPQLVMWWVMSSGGVDPPFNLYHSQLAMWQVVTIIVEFFWSCARTTKNGTTSCHNSPRGKLWLMKKYLWTMWGHSFTSHNLPYGELWHKVVPFSVVSVMAAPKILFRKVIKKF